MPALANEFAGSWHVAEARYPTGEFAYTGTICIKTNGSAFDLDWDISAGHYAGIGLRADSHLFVSCGEHRAGLGIALFRTQSDAAVSVQWSSPEMRGALGTGEFISRSSGSFEGTHELLLHLPDGSSHASWSVRIKRVGRVFELQWCRGDVIHFQGLGLEMADGLAVSWYPDLKQLAFLDYVFDSAHADQLSAVWALGGYSQLGTERLTRK